MADRIADELLRFTATSSFRPHDDEVRAIAVELLAARARIKSLEGCIVRNMEAAIRRIPKAGAVRFDPVMVALARASQERDAARADLREAMDLLGNEEIGHQEWLSRWRQLRKKHKETP